MSGHSNSTRKFKRVIEGMCEHFDIYFTLFSFDLNTSTGVDLTKLFFLRFFFFGVKLGHFTINIFFLYVTKMQAYQRKTEKFFVSEEKKFGRIDSAKKYFIEEQFITIKVIFFHNQFKLYIYKS